MNAWCWNSLSFKFFIFVFNLNVEWSFLTSISHFIMKATFIMFHILPLYLLSMSFACYFKIKNSFCLCYISKINVKNIRLLLGFLWLKTLISNQVLISLHKVLFSFFWKNNSIILHIGNIMYSANNEVEKMQLRFLILYKYWVNGLSQKQYQNDCVATYKNYFKIYKFKLLLISIVLTFKINNRNNSSSVKQFFPYLSS